ncbi:LPXTG cell wall anchor domain-containing protein [Nocardioides sp.]|uniref:LPXTG cell wall anchor domain-containing protein n=1 Tax=Nocardioides sp. TaxID=35761 RepID=UPI0035644668
MSTSLGVLGALVALLLLGVGAVPAAAEGSDRVGHQIALSADGVHFDRSLAHPLFDPATRWVPGDVRRSHFWVRNQAGGPGDLSIVLIPGRRMGLDTEFLRIESRAGDGPWRSISGIAETSVVDNLTVAANGQTRITIRVRMSPQAPRATMLRSADLNLLVTLTDASVSSPGNGPENPGGELPDTGTTVPWFVLPVGVLLMALGLFLLVGARRSERDNEPDPWESHHGHTQI